MSECGEKPPEVTKDVWMIWIPQCGSARRDAFDWCDPRESCCMRMGGGGWVEVVPASGLASIQETAQEFLEWFDRRFPVGGKRLPGVALYSIAEDFRAALKEKA